MWALGARALTRRPTAALSSSLWEQKLCRAVSSTATPSSPTQRHTLDRRYFHASPGVTTDGPRSFDQLLLHESTVRAVTEVLQYSKLSKTQEMVLPIVLDTNDDLIVRANTGTGKTLCYVLPLIEACLKSTSLGVRALVVAPTRELVLQITKEIEDTITYHKLQVIPLVGGVPRRQDNLAIRRKKPQILVCTPGRLVDHLEGTLMFPNMLQQLDLLVIDEVDRLLDLGFLESVKEIFGYLPQQRRSMFFSATIPHQVLDLSVRFMRGNFRRVDALEKDASVTPSEVKQTYAIIPPEHGMKAVYDELNAEMQNNPFTYKVLVFFPTARMTQFFANFFREQLRLPVLDLHRRKDQAQRVVTQNRFLNAKKAVMFTSDVSARGMDYPNITFVMQLCAPPSKDQYIHRIGRTGRAGKDGRAHLLLLENEAGFVDLCDDIPWRRTEFTGKVNELLLQALSSWSSSTLLNHQAAAAFASMLMHYKVYHRALNLSDDIVVRSCLRLMTGTGMVHIPVISKRLANVLKIDKHPLLRVSQDLDEDALVGDFSVDAAEKERNMNARDGTHIHKFG